MADTTIYDLAGRIILDNARPPRARAVARRLQKSVIVEDWDRCRRYRVTRTGLVRPPPPYWVPADMIDASIIEGDAMIAAERAARAAVEIEAMAR